MIIAKLFGPGFPDSLPKNEARKLQIPVLLVYGEESPKFFHSISDKLLELFPHGRKVVIPGTSHETHGDNPEVYNEEVMGFINNYE
ncbi:MAG: alpha/beta hydrolase [Balneolales bacterium]